MIKSNESLPDSPETISDTKNVEFVEVPEDDTEGFTDLGERGLAGLRDLIGVDRKTEDRERIKKLTKELDKATKKTKK